MDTMLRKIQELTGLLFRRRARRAKHGMLTLRRAYEHVVVMAVMEGARPVRLPYYEGYVDALHILDAKAASIARTLWPPMS